MRGSAGLFSEAGASGTGASMPPWMRNDRRGNNARGTGEDLRKKSRSRDRRGSKREDRKSKPSDLENQNASTLERDADPEEDIFARDESLHLQRR